MRDKKDLEKHLFEIFTKTNAIIFKKTVGLEHFIKK